MSENPNEQIERLIEEDASAYEKFPKGKDYVAKRISANEETVLISVGRSPNCDIQFPDEETFLSVSNLHVAILAKGKVMPDSDIRYEIVVSDQNSSNGTYLRWFGSKVWSRLGKAGESIFKLSDSEFSNDALLRLTHKDIFLGLRVRQERGTLNIILEVFPVHQSLINNLNGDITLPNVLERILNAGAALRLIPRITEQMISGKSYNVKALSYFQRALEIFFENL